MLHIYKHAYLTAHYGSASVEREDIADKRSRLSKVRHLLKEKNRGGRGYPIKRSAIGERGDWHPLSHSGPQNDELVWYFAIVKHSRFSAHHVGYLDYGIDFWLRKYAFSPGTLNIKAKDTIWSDLQREKVQQ